MEEKKRASALDETYVKLYNEIFEKEKNKSKISFRTSVRKIMMTQCYISLLIVFTILALFFDDFRHLVAFRSTDNIFYGITVAIIVFFIVGRPNRDIILQAVVDPGYLASFVFFTDVISVLSLTFDIGWIYENFFFDYYEYTQFGLLSISNYIATNTIDFSSYIEILRYLRLVRILSWMRIFYKYQKKWFMNETLEEGKTFQINRKAFCGFEDYKLSEHFGKFEKLRNFAKGLY